jgi:hypothetical protein
VAQLRRLQGLADNRFAPVAQLAGGPEEEELVQGKFATAQPQLQLQQAPRANNTGLPDQLKSGIESLSGLSMDHVRVHYNSSQPAQLNALAYAQGSDIYLAPGQERHLPHEAWHVVQQAQGRVRPTMHMKEGVAVNDDPRLEDEANQTGQRAFSTSATFATSAAQRTSSGVSGLGLSASSVQRVRVQDSASGDFHETNDMSDQDVTALALRFYQLHNIAELRKIQAAHPDLAISMSTLYQLAYGQPHPRSTKRHEDSEGESENDDPTIAHRSLRLDEDSPQLLGLSAPVGHNQSITARAHINSGSRAKIKSRFISASRSIKKAGAWASTNTVDEKVGRVASFDIPYGTSSGDVAPVDVTRPDVQDELFPNGGSALNSAKASQEVLVPDRVPPRVHTFHL